MYQPQHLPCFKNFSVFYAPTVPHPLLTSIPTRPARIRTTSPPRRTHTQTHHYTPANTSPLPLRLTVPPHRTTVPPHSTPASQPHHCTTLPATPPHHTTPPATPFPYHTTAPFRHPQAVPTQYRRRTDAAPATTSARVAAGPTSTLTTAYRRRNAVTPPRHRPDASTPVAVPSGPQARL